MAEKSCNSDEELFATWVREHGRAVRGFLLAMVRRPDVADELSQEVFCRAWQARQRYREQGNARAYLLRIADRLVCDHGRRRKPYVHLNDDGWQIHEPVDPARGPSSAAIVAEHVELLSAALDRLSPSQRRVLLLRYYGQLTFAEIATETGIPLNTTLSHCRRGLEALRALLVEESP
ncbi:MAG: RNA polymerase sigma factor [Planctomycetaceae bacterium]|nr:RNA polymerase sigma factor [Planctomycetaceae bacterium]